MKSSTFILLCIFSFSLVHGQWIKEKGSGYSKISGWSLLADEHFTDQGKIDPNATRGLFISSIYLQYGLSKNVNFIAYLPLLVKNYQYAQISKTNGNTYEPRQVFNGLGDINLGMEYGLKTSGKWVLSSTLTLGLPSGKAVAGSDGSFQTGDGEFNQLIQLNAGSGFSIGGQNLYLKSYLGLNNRTKGFSDEVHTYFETGSQFLENNLLILGRLHWTKPLYNGTLDASNSNGTIFANNIESLVIGFETAINLGEQWGLSVAITHPISGKVIYRAQSYSGGIFFNF